MNKNTKSITIPYAAAELRVSDSTVKRLIRRGTLHTTRPKKFRGHWTSFILVDKAFKDEQHRRMHGLKAPRRKHILDTYRVQKEFERKAREQKMNEICEQWCKDDPSTIQTVTPKQKSELTQASLERAENAMHICLIAQEACEKALRECRVQAAKCQAEHTLVDDTVNYVVTAKTECWRRERTCVRCTAILAAACILQLLLAAYYTLCHFNII